MERGLEAGLEPGTELGVEWGAELRMEWGLTPGMECTSDIGMEWGLVTCKLPEPRTECRVESVKEYELEAGADCGLANGFVSCCSEVLSLNPPALTLSWVVMEDICCVSPNIPPSSTHTIAQIVSVRIESGMV